MIGTTVSHYKILEKLGEGGMGVVYKAQDTKLNRLVAVKFLPKQVHSSEDVKARFLQEAQAAASLNHPNICTIHGIEEHDGQMFIVMEFVEGQTLREKGLNMPSKQAVDIGVQLADGLAAAHEKGIVHRDIKPENIMIHKDGRVQIMDFGLAKLKGASRLTKEGSTVGTAGYMSPEQVQGQDADHRTDIFSLGIILYELLAGQSPFKGVHETAISYEIVNVDPDPISSIKPEINPELDAIVLDCLEKDLKERCQSVAEVARNLRRFKRQTSRTRMGSTTAARPAFKPSEVLEPSEGLTTKKFFAVENVVAGIAVLALIALGIIHFAESPPEARVYRSIIPPPEKNMFSTTAGGHIALSPDGRLLAFVATDSSGKSLLWVRPLNALAGQPLNGTDDALFPFWSPDSRFIGFFAGTKLKKIDATGGPPQTICDAPIGRGGTWNKEGVIVFCPHGALGVSLSRVSAEGGVPVVITKLDASRNEINHRWPYFLPDGKHFLYNTRIASGGVTEADAIFLASLDTTFKPRLLLNASSSMAYSNGHILFLREQALMARPFDVKQLEFTGEAFPIAEQVHFWPGTSKASFSISDHGILAYQTGAAVAGGRLIWYDRSGKQVGAISRISTYNDLRLSPDGKRIAVSDYDSKNKNQDILLYEIGRALWTRFTFDPALERWPRWSPDGNTVVFTSPRKGYHGLYLRASSGAGNEELLFGSDINKSASDWSTDGKFLAFQALDPKTQNDIWILPMKGERKPSLFLKTEFDEWRAAFSPDGRWIAYESSESGNYEVYVLPFTGSGGRRQVSTSGGTRPHWRRDGKELFFLSTDNKIMTAEIKLGSTTVDVGSIRPLFQIRPYLFGPADIYDVTKDGQRFLVATSAGMETSSPVTLVVNWLAEVKKK